MSNFGRSFKSGSSHLSQHLRPGLGNRTLSNSSDRSHDSDGSNGSKSGRKTPQGYKNRRYPAPLSSFESNSVGSTSNLSAQENTSRSTSNTSSPIAIELPRSSRNIGSNSVYTPPEPLSARGDRAGGYFPNHEDPKSRVQRTHPFHSDKKYHDTRTTASNPAQDAHTPGPVGSYRDQRGVPRANTTSAAMGAANMNAPMASYYTTGHDHSLPMGKYYPSNYERTHPQHPVSSSPNDVRPSGPTSGPQSFDPARQGQLQQYQRAMMAQATRGVHQTMDQQNQSPSQVGGLGMRAMNKPDAPRLHPLGSPGPVTPMELESSGTTSAGGTGTGGSYLDKGRGGSRRTSQAALAPPGSGFSPRSM